MATLKTRIEALATTVGNYLRDSVLPRLLPAGGAEGAVLTKTAAGDYAVGWAPGADGAGLTTGTAEIDFGLSPASEGSVVVTDAAISATSVIDVFVQGGDTTADNDANAHSFAAISMRLVATPGAGSFTINAFVLLGRARGSFKVRYRYNV